MSNREPSLLRRLYPALALTGVGFGLVNVLDRPSPTQSLATGALAPTDASATTVVAGTDAAAAATTTVPASQGQAAAQGQAATPVTQAPAATAAPAPAPTAAPVTAAPAPSNDCGAIEKTGSTATIVHRREYGVIQVIADFTSAKELCKVSANYQTYDQKSDRYENYAVPILNKQAESAKSANIQGVSGATAVSVAYQQSLQSALDQL